MKKYRMGMVFPHRIGRWEYTLNMDGSVCLREYYGSRDVLEIPESLMGRPVTSLGRNFGGADYMQVLIIPDTVRAIGPHACAAAEELRAVWIPASVTSIHETAFEDQEHMTIFTPEGSAAHRFAMENGILFELDAMPEMEEDDEAEADGAECSWRVWGDYCFAVNDRGEALLREYSGTAGELIVPGELDGFPLVYVLRGAFRGNDFLQEVSLPSGVKEVGCWAFADCPSLRAVRLPRGLEYLGDGAFAHCADLESIDLPAQLEMINLFTFCGCCSLSEVTLPERMRIIFPMAFVDCRELKTLRLNSALESIVGDPFQNCPKLRRPATLPDTLDGEARALLEALPA